MEEKETKEILIELLKALIALRKELRDRNCEEDDQAEKKIMEELKEDYQGFFKWALDLEENESIYHREMAERWKKLHPDLPVPRVALLKEDPTNNFMLFLMDAYPLYLEHRKEEE